MVHLATAVTNTNAAITAFAVQSISTLFVALGSISETIVQEKQKKILLSLTYHYPTTHQMLVVWNRWSI